DELVVVERRPRTCEDERLRQVAEERLPDERDERQAERKDKQAPNPERSRPAGAAELDARGSIAFAGHGGEGFRVLRGATIEQYGKHADREQRQGERACHSESRRRRDDGALNIGGKHVDARWPADQARHLIGGHAHPGGFDCTSLRVGRRPNLARNSWHSRLSMKLAARRAALGCGAFALTPTWPKHTATGSRPR